MRHYLKKAVSDIRSNKFLNIITIVTISLCIFVVSAFALFFNNTCRIIKSREKGVKIIAFLKPQFNIKMLPQLEFKINTTGKVRDIIFISKNDALKRLKKDMDSRSTFLNSLKKNPLPDAVKITVKNSVNKWDTIEAFAAQLKKIPMVDDVEYGEKWLGKFLSVVNLFKITGYAVSVIFFMIAVFITANTIRLAFYSRKEEVEIMRLVGATDKFIITPFYIEGVLLGLAGGIAGLAILFLLFILLSSGIEKNISLYMLFNIKFLSVKYIAIIIACSAFSGWIGCYLSLKQFLKY